jgi:hypothetical protein
MRRTTINRSPLRGLFNPNETPYLPHHASCITLHFSVPYTRTLKVPGTTLGRPFFPPEG